jgi:hypothetical protein
MDVTYGQLKEFMEKNQIPEESILSINVEGLPLPLNGMCILGGPLSKKIYLNFECDALSTEIKEKFERLPF